MDISFDNLVIEADKINGLVRQRSTNVLPADNQSVGPAVPAEEHPNVAIAPAGTAGPTPLTRKARPTVGTAARSSDLKVVMYKNGKPRTFPSFGHLRIGLVIMAKPNSKLPAATAFKMTIEHGKVRQEFTDPVKAQTVLQLKLTELEKAGKPYTINGQPSAAALRNPLRNNKQRGGKSGGGGGLGGGKAGGKGGGSGGGK